MQDSLVACAAVEPRHATARPDGQPRRIRRSLMRHRALARQRQACEPGCPPDNPYGMRHQPAYCAQHAAGESTEADMSRELTASGHFPERWPLPGPRPFAVAVVVIIGSESADGDARWSRY